MRQTRHPAGGVDDEGRVRLDDFERQLSTRTRLVSFSHVSNVAGYINPAAEICSRSRSAGARVMVDAAQAAPHIPVDVQALDCDFLVIRGHTPGEILRYLESRGIAVRAGDLSALPLLKHLGVTEAARASCYVYTQTSELDRLAEALHQMTRTPTRTEDTR